MATQTHQIHSRLPDQVSPSSAVLQLRNAAPLMISHMSKRKKHRRGRIYCGFYLNRQPNGKRGSENRLPGRSPPCDPFRAFFTVRLMNTLNVRAIVAKRNYRVQWRKSLLLRREGALSRHEVLAAAWSEAFPKHDIETARLKPPERLQQFDSERWHS